MEIFLALYIPMFMHIHCKTQMWNVLMHVWRDWRVYDICKWVGGFEEMRKRTVFNSCNFFLKHEPAFQFFISILTIFSPHCILFFWNFSCTIFNCPVHIYMNFETLGQKTNYLQVFNYWVQHWENSKLCDLLTSPKTKHRELQETKAKMTWFA